MLSTRFSADSNPFSILYLQPTASQQVIFIYGSTQLYTSAYRHCDQGKNGKDRYRSWRDINAHLYAGGYGGKRKGS